MIFPHTLFNASARREPLKISGWKLSCKTREVGLPNGENFIILISTIFVCYTRHRQSWKPITNNSTTLPSPHGAHNWAKRSEFLNMAASALPYGNRSRCIATSRNTRRSSYRLCMRLVMLLLLYLETPLQWATKAQLCNLFFDKNSKFPHAGPGPRVIQRGVAIG